MLFDGWEVRMVKNCDRGLENAVNWFCRLQMGLFTQFLSLNRLARRLLTICKKSWQRASNSDSRQRKMY